MRKNRTKNFDRTLEINYDDLILELKKGNNEAFKQVIEKFGSGVYFTAYRITHSHSESEEVLQDVFITVYKKIHSLKKFEALGNWINRITVNLANMKIRDKNENQVLLNTLNLEKNELTHPNEFMISENTIDCLLHTEIQGVINKAISELPPKYKSVIVLNDLKNFSIRKTSDILNISVPAVKSRLYRARKQLKNKLDLYFLEKAN